MIRKSIFDSCAWAARPVVGLAFLALGLAWFLASPDVARATQTNSVTVSNPGFETTGNTATSFNRICVGTDWTNPQQRPTTGWPLTVYDATTGGEPGMSYGSTGTSPTTDHSLDRATGGTHSMPFVSAGCTTGNDGNNKATWLGQQNVAIGVDGLGGAVNFRIRANGNSWNWTQLRPALAVDINNGTAPTASTDQPTNPGNNLWGAFQHPSSGYALANTSNGNISVWVGARRISTAGTGAYIDDVVVERWAVLQTVAPAVGSIGNNTATVTWTTDENSSSIVEYSTDLSFSSSTTGASATSHSVNLTGLAAGTAYNYRVRSRLANYAQYLSSNGTFTTTGVANSVPTLGTLSISSVTLLPDDVVQYTTTLTASDANGVNDIHSMRIMFHDNDANLLTNTKARGYLTWGLADADITRYGGTWTIVGNATNGGRWGWFNGDWGSNTYISPVACTTSTAGNQRTVTFTFTVKPAWGGALDQDGRGFVDDAATSSSWNTTNLDFDILGVWNLIGNVPTLASTDNPFLHGNLRLASLAMDKSGNVFGSANISYTTGGFFTWNRSTSAFTSTSLANQAGGSGFNYSGITRLVMAGDGNVYALANQNSSMGNDSTRINAILRLNLNGTFTQIWRPSSFSGAPADPAANTDQTNNVIRGMDRGPDGNLYWLMDGVSSFWRTHSMFKYNVASGVVSVWAGDGVNWGFSENVRTGGCMISVKPDITDVRLTWVTTGNGNWNPDVFRFQVGDRVDVAASQSPGSMQGTTNSSYGADQDVAWFGFRNNSANTSLVCARTTNASANSWTQAPFHVIRAAEQTGAKGIWVGGSATDSNGDWWYSVESDGTYTGQQYRRASRYSRTATLNTDAAINDEYVVDAGGQVLAFAVIPGANGASGDVPLALVATDYGASSSYRLYSRLYALGTAPTYTAPVDASVCSTGGNASFTVSPGTGTAFLWRKNGKTLSNGGTISGATTATLTVTGATSVDAGAYDCVIRTAANNSSIVTNAGTLSIASSPNIALTVTPSSTTICTGSTVGVTVAGSESGVTYQLFNGASPSGSSGNGNGGNLVLTSAALSSSATLTVKATRSPCAQVTLTQSVAVTVNQSPNTGLGVTPTSTTICSGSTVNVTVGSSENGVTYQLFDGASPSGSSGSGNGGSLVLTSGALSTSTTFSVKATRSPCAQVTLTQTVAVTVTQPPNIGLSVTPSSTTICSGSTVAVTVGSSESGVTYQIFDGASPSGSSGSGNGGNLVLTSAALSSSTTLSVKATRSPCAQVTLTQTVAVTVNQPPNTGLSVTPSNITICSGSTVAVTVGSSESDVTYQLYDGASPSGSSSNGNGGNLVLTSAALTSSTTLTVKATRSPCSQVTLSNSVAVTVDLIDPPTAICQNVNAPLIAGFVTVLASSVNDGSTTDVGCGQSITAVEIAKGNANCASGTFASSVTFDCTEIGSQTVTLRITQTDGQKSCCTASADVTNATPIITQGAGPLSLTVATGSTCPGAANEIALAATDANGDTLAWTVSGSPSVGSANISGSPGNNVTVCYAPSGGPGSDSFTIRVADGCEAGSYDEITVNVTIANTPTLTSAKSVRTHGPSTELAIETIGGGMSEPRRNGIQKLRFTFSELVECATHGGTPNSGDVSSSAVPSIVVPAPASIGFVGGGSSGTQLVVTYNAGDLPDLHEYTFDLAGKFKSQATGLVLGGTPSVTVRGMEGDVTCNGMVTNVGDVAQTKNSNGLKLVNSTLNDSTCQYDVNTDGSVNLIDVAYVKTKITP